MILLGFLDGAFRGVSVFWAPQYKPQVRKSDVAERFQSDLHPGEGRTIHFVIIYQKFACATLGAALF